ncbi:hypothetical protein [Tomitella biformata]|uniref:hypothetical protein n=1 Tax=Tomitella biformata TaxID=630403 RepID=UPI0004656E4B|nr:hypothetical protein [Tomitella biformata]
MAFTPALDVPAVIGGVIDELKSAGLSATAEPADLNPPCAWVAVDKVEHSLLCGGGVVRVRIYLIAPDVGTMQAHRTLSEMLDKALTVIDPDQDTVLDEGIRLPAGGGPLPAYMVTAEIETP